jgi:hypothetical protein
MDLAQLAGPVTAFVLVSGRLGPQELVVLAGLLSAVVLLLNALGMALAAIVKGNPEVHLAGALAVGATALGSGLLPLPERIAGVIGATTPYNPVSLLAEALRKSVEGTLDAAPRGTAVAAAILACVFAAALARAADRPAPRRPRRESV